MKITAVNTPMIGQAVPTNQFGHAGRFCEQYLQLNGWPVDSASSGADIPQYQLEIKSRDIDAVSHHTVGTMLPDTIKKTAYKHSLICKKLQQQFRIKIKDQVVVDATVYDFSHPKIQKIFENGYENARQTLCQNQEQNYVRGNEFCFFERQNGKTSYKFRIYKNKMQTLEHMAMRARQYDMLYNEDQQ